MGNLTRYGTKHRTSIEKDIKIWDKIKWCVPKCRLKGPLNHRWLCNTYLWIKYSAACPYIQPPKICKAIHIKKPPIFLSMEGLYYLSHIRSQAANAWGSKGTPQSSSSSSDDLDDQTLMVNFVAVLQHLLLLCWLQNKHPNPNFWRYKMNCFNVRIFFLYFFWYT